VGSPLAVADGLLGEEGDFVTGVGADEAHRCLSLLSPKRRSPAPSTTGKTMSGSSSTTSCSIEARASWMLPATTISPSRSCLGFEASCTASPASTVELFHPGASSVEDTTLSGRLFNRSANAPVRDGQRAARNS
jgi:hypothetical protein